MENTCRRFNTYCDSIEVLRQKIIGDELSSDYLEGEKTGRKEDGERQIRVRGRSDLRNRHPRFQEVNCNCRTPNASALYYTELA